MEEDARVSPIPKPAASPDAVLQHLRPGIDLIVQPDNGEPVTVMSAIDAAAGMAPSSPPTRT
jgi:hypothetical protein